MVVCEIQENPRRCAVLITLLEAAEDALGDIATTPTGLRTCRRFLGAPCDVLDDMLTRSPGRSVPILRAVNAAWA